MYQVEISKKNSLYFKIDLLEHYHVKFSVAFISRIDRCSIFPSDGIIVLGRIEQGRQVHDSAIVTGNGTVR